MGRYEWLYWAVGIGSLGYFFLKEILRLFSGGTPASTSEIGAAALFRFQAHLEGSTLDEDGLHYQADGYAVHIATRYVDIRFPKAPAVPFPFYTGDLVPDEIHWFRAQAGAENTQIITLLHGDPRAALYTKGEPLAALWKRGRVLVDAEGLRFIGFTAFPGAEDDPFLKDVVVFHELMALAKAIAEPGDVIDRLRDALAREQDSFDCAGLARIWCAWDEMNVIRDAAWPAPLGDAASAQGADVARWFLHLRVAKPDHFDAFLDLAKRVPQPLHAEFLTHIKRFTAKQQADILRASVEPEGMPYLALQGAVGLQEAFARPLLVAVLAEMLKKPRGSREIELSSVVSSIKGFEPHATLDAVLLQGLDRGSETGSFLDTLATVGTEAMVAELAMRRKKVKAQDRAQLEETIGRLKTRYGLVGDGNAGALSPTILGDTAGGLSPTRPARGHLSPAEVDGHLVSAAEERGQVPRQEPQ